jgi:hypothetical protein
MENAIRLSEQHHDETYSKFLNKHTTKAKIFIIANTNTYGCMASGARLELERPYARRA